MNGEPIVRAPLPTGERIRVVFADPDERLLTVYRQDLYREFEVETASDGVECAACLRERIPDVLVLEPQVPWGGGGGVLAMMHDVPKLANVPVMILTSCRELAVLNGVAPFRIRDYCIKPLAARQLAIRIRFVVGAFRMLTKFDLPEYETTSKE